MPTEHSLSSTADTGARPAGWTGKRYSTWGLLSIVTLAVIALAGLAGAVTAFASAELITAFALLAGVVYLVHLAGLGLAARWTPRRAVRPATLATPDGGHTGLTFRYSLWAYYWVVSVLSLTVVALVGLAALSAATATGAGVVVAAVVGILALVIVWFLITVLRLAPGVVTLTPEGVYHRSLTFTHYVPWFAIFAVEAEWTDVPLIAVKAFPSDGTRVRRYTGGLGTQEVQLLPYLAVRAQWLGTDPTVVYRTLAYYYAHPGQRAELGTTAAIDKVNGVR